MIDTSVNMLKLGKKIQQARKRSRITQEELAKAVGISDKSVSAYEANRISPSLKVLEKIAEKTQSPLSYFFEENVEGDILAKLKQLEKEFDEIKNLLKK
ncbi:MAG: helix-turn-helix transcriptional regulator [Patescibacteria group bacterium]